MRKNALMQILLAEIKQEKLPAPVLEHQFHPIRRWRMDAAWPDKKVGLEVHGAIWTNGHHVRGKGFEDDREKSNEAQLLGWKLLEYSTGQIRNGMAILDLKRALEK